MREATPAVVGRPLVPDALGLLTVYLVLLLAVPSSVRITALGSLGRPSLLWGVLIFGAWLLWRLQARPGDLSVARQPVRLAFFALFAVALVSLAAALLRGQPPDQVSPAVTSVIRLLSWSGPLLCAMDGLRTREDVFTMVRRVALAGGLLAAFGLLQFVSGQSLLDWIRSIPGLEVEADSGVAVRGAFTRASGTAIHPLEHATALAASLPLAMAVAIIGRKRWGAPDRSMLGWWAVAVIALGSVLAVSRSAVIGLGVAVLATIPALPKRLRTVLIGSGVAMAAVAVAGLPGLMGTVVGLFAPSGDASIQSRTDALARVPEFLRTSPVYGAGFGTFLPRYYIFDNEWVLLLVELGILGALSFAALFGFSMASGARAASGSSDPDWQLLVRALAASVLTVAVCFAFFDGLSFPIAAGLAFLLFGVCGAVRAIAVEERTERPSAYDNSAILLP